MKRNILLLIVLSLMISTLIAVPVRVLIIRGGYSSVGWSNICEESYNRCNAICDSVDGIDIILFPEFAFAGTDGGTHSKPEVTFEYDSVWGFIPQPRDSVDEDIRAAIYLDSLRYIAIRETCHIWASTCGEVIGSTNYNTLPIFLPDGKLYRLRRKNLGTDITRDTTIHLDSIYTKAGPRIAVMTTICYENGSYGFTPYLDPPDPPAPLWLLPHGSWPPAGDPYLTYRTQRWMWSSSPIDLSGVWRIPSDGWVSADAVLISADIYGTEWTATRISNYGDDLESLAYEPLAWVDEHPRFVVVDMNIPDVDDPEPVVRARPLDRPYFDQLTALPKISSGEIYIEGASANTAEIYNRSGELVETIELKDGIGRWIGRFENSNPPGKYTIIAGAEKDSIDLIE